MVFSSVLFIFYFLPISIILYYIFPNNRAKNFVFLAISLGFYAFGEPIYIFIMLLSMAFTFFLMKNYEKLSDRHKKIRIIIATLQSVVIFIFFKYTNFLLGITNDLFSLNIPFINVTLPLGISFFTFQLLSYVFDVAKGSTPPQKSLHKLCLYIFAFPQLIAGPIVRYSDVLNQIDNRTHTLKKVEQGIILFVIGLSKKVLIANALGAAADAVFGLEYATMSVMTAWIGAISYTLQIYFDFSGYSDMARGLGKIFGFEFLENFNYPYISKSISEFWRRWHISLGSWFRDYVYFPLGGNRVSKLKLIRNLLIVWGLTGLWHGASFNFLVWGLYYCFFIILEKFAYKLMGKIPNPILHIYTLLVVVIGWIFFRADTLTLAIEYIKMLFTATTFIDTTAGLLINNYKWMMLAGVVFSIPIKIKIPDNIYTKCIKLCILYAMFLLSVASLVNSSYNPFIYFRF